MRSRSRRDCESIVRLSHPPVLSLVCNFRQLMMLSMRNDEEGSGTSRIRGHERQKWALFIFIALYGYPALTLPFQLAHKYAEYSQIQTLHRNYRKHRRQTNMILVRYHHKQTLDGKTKRVCTPRRCRLINHNHLCQAIGHEQGEKHYYNPDAMKTIQWPMPL